MGWVRAGRSGWGQGGVGWDWVGQGRVGQGLVGRDGWVHPLSLLYLPISTSSL